MARDDLSSALVGLLNGHVVLVYLIRFIKARTLSTLQCLNYQFKYLCCGLQSLRREHTAVRQRFLDSSRPTGEEAERLPLSLSPTHPQHHLAGKSPKRHNPGTGWNSQHVHSAETETPALAWSCCEDGRWPDPKGSPLRRTSAGKAPHRQTTASLQRCLQKGSEGLGN